MDDKNDSPKIIVDEDWKSKVDREREQANVLQQDLTGCDRDHVGCVPPGARIDRQGGCEFIKHCLLLLGCRLKGVLPDQ